MKTRIPLTLAAILLLIVLATEPVIAQSARVAQSGRVARAIGPDAVGLLIILLNIFSKLVGLAAVLAAGIFARGKLHEMKVGALVVAAIGGIWTAYDWLGWPYYKVPRSGLLVLLGKSPPYSWEFSLLRLIGVGFFPIICAAICAVIAKGGDDGGNGTQNG